jgi:hypothetical protein
MINAIRFSFLIIFLILILLYRDSISHLHQMTIFHLKKNIEMNKTDIMIKMMIMNEILDHM